MIKAKKVIKTIAVLAGSISFAFSQATDDGIGQITGGYSNPVYGYSVTVPSGKVALVAKPPFPNHGLKIQLSTTPDMSIWCDGSYDSEGYTSVDQARTRMFQWSQGDDPGATMPRQSSGGISGLKYSNFVINYTDSASNTKRVLEYYVMLRSEPKTQQIIYTFGFDAPESQYSTNRPIFSSLVMSLSTQPIQK